MRRFGLIGFPLSHSFSKKFFTKKFQEEGIAGCEYELFPIENIGLFKSLIEGDRELEGINVTIPYKLDVIQYVDEIDDAARQIGAVNCISVRRNNDGRLFLSGFNTDAYGFMESLLPLLEPHHTKALVFGNGGAAKAVKYVLRQLGMPFLVVTRNPAGDAISYGQVDAAMLDEYTVLINTTPLGMSPDYDTCPDIPYGGLSEKHLAYDLVYNPEETVFLQKSKERGSKIKNGLEMLHLQAERSWHIWNSK